MQTTTRTREQNHLLDNKLFIALIAFIVFIAATFIARSLRAQLTEYDLSRPMIQQSGQLFTIRYEPGGPRLDVLTTGLPVAKVEPNQIEVLGYQIDLSGARQEFRLKWNRGYYDVMDPIDPSLRIRVEVIEKDSNRSEVFELDPQD